MNFFLKNLKTEYLESPLGIDVQSPRFSWQMQSAQKGKQQVSYRLTVGTKENLSDMWDSGVVKNKYSHEIKYQGKELQPVTRYYWTVTVTDERGEYESSSSFFETGLMNPSMQAWEGAQWIGSKTNNLAASVKGVFSIESNFYIQEGFCAGLIFGANDHRLLDKYKNIYSLQGENYIAYVIDIHKIPAKLKIYRVGYNPEDRDDIPFFSKDIFNLENASDTILTEENKRKEHHLKIEVFGNTAKAYLDGKIIDEVQKDNVFSSGEKISAGRILNPLGENDVMTFPRLNEVGFYAEEGTKAFYRNLIISDIRTPQGVLLHETPDKKHHIFQNKKEVQIQEQCFVVKGSKVTADPSHSSIPILKREIKVKKESRLISARLYTTARGIYECHINGKRISEDFFQPGASQYDKHIYYQTYDVTQAFCCEKNVIGFYLASGWWSDSQTFTVSNHNYFGDRPSLLAKIVCFYEDGSREVVVTDTENWECSAEGPIRYASFFHGEHHDARLYEEYQKAFKGQSQKIGWEKPVEIKPVPIRNTAKGFHLWPECNLTEPKLVGQRDKPVQKIAELTAQNVTEVRPNVYIYDMGQNMVGVPCIKFKGDKGQKITIRYAEILYPNLPEYENLQGLPLTENLRDALCTDFYICQGSKDGEVFMPRFTFHGYRYLEITGVRKIPKPEEVKGIVLSSILQLNGNFETSNPLVNRLYQNVLWSQRANFISIPTDCPQRNERMGWTGDAQVFVPTALYNADSRTLYYRYMQACRDVQAKNGRFADIAPIGGGFGGIVWGSAGVIIPWAVYSQLGDVGILEENYDAMKRYLSYLEENYEAGLLKPGVGHLGDWLAVDMSTDNDAIFNAVLAYDAKIMSAIAERIGNIEDAKHYSAFFATVKKDWNQRFVSSKGYTLTIDGKINDTQTSYAVPLFYGVADEENAKKMAEYLNRKTKELNYRLTTGFVGTAMMNQVLSDYGYHETAYRLLVETQYPSWLYPVTQGATTIWERWNSYTIENGFGGNNSMNSFNHYSLGAVCAWFYRDILGIRGEIGEGYHHFILKPIFYGFAYAKGYYDSPYGRIGSAWKNEGGEIRYEVEIPPNSRAKIYFPCGKVRSSDEFINLTEERDSISGEKYYMYPVLSGKYKFTWQQEIQNK